MAANLARGVDLVASIERAVEVASISVQSKGAQPSYANLSTLPPSLHPPVN
jgi:sugar/nucleoside kinase (ribokinase family)